MKKRKKEGKNLRDLISGIIIGAVLGLILAYFIFGGKSSLGDYEEGEVIKFNIEDVECK